jgi:hypothetical protein
MPVKHRVNKHDWAADAAIPGWEGSYCAVVVAAADGDVVAMFGLMTSVGDCAESGARTMTVLVEVAVRPVWSLTTY